MVNTLCLLNRTEPRKGESTCPVCGELLLPSGVDGGSWVHLRVDPPKSGRMDPQEFAEWYIRNAPKHNSLRTLHEAYMAESGSNIIFPSFEARISHIKDIFASRGYVLPELSLRHIDVHGLGKKYNLARIPPKKR